MADRKAYMLEWRSRNREHIENYRKTYKRPEGYKDYQKQYGKKYYIEHIEEFAKRNKEYREAHKEQISVSRKEKYKKNKIKYVERSRCNRELHRDKINKRQRELQKSDTMRYKSYRLTRSALGRIKKQDLQRIYEDNIKRYGTLTCILCEKSIIFGDDTIEHILPINRGGTNEYYNLGVAHRSCNSRKQDKTMEEYKNFLYAIKAEQQ